MFLSVANDFAGKKFASKKLDYLTFLTIGTRVSKWQLVIEQNSVYLKFNLMQSKGIRFTKLYKIIGVVVARFLFALKNFLLYIGK